MAKAKTNDADQPSGEIQSQVPVKLLPSSVTLAEDPKGKSVDNIQVSNGEVLLISVDADGNETGDPFKVNAGTYSKYYSDETKFLVKKNHV